ncbi:MAG TPA: FliM/FliN family flagellar motor C-terminal domain-containing protein [Bryocella sp.]|nr:FliM/FliN family flagellar motor C-terminal domain-containing protein [Bryocella sp.]
MSDTQTIQQVTPQTSVVDGCKRFAWLPFGLTVEVPVSHFTLRQFLCLQPGDVVSSGWRKTRETPLYANRQLIGWTEFYAVGERIGARLTEIA